MDFDSQLDNERKRFEEQSDLHDLENLVIIWARKRKILSPDNSKGQLLKSFSEMGELADAVLKNDLLGITDGIGDVLVTLIILANQYNLDLYQCLEHAYSEIKDRKGKTINGTFVKEAK